MNCCNIEYAQNIEPGTLWKSCEKLIFSFSDEEIDITIPKNELLMFLQVVEDPTDFCYVRADFLYKNKILFWFFDKNPRLVTPMRLLEKV